MKRYKIVEGSTSGHCCFECSVVDTRDGKEDYGDYWKTTICETFERTDAELICNALNSDIELKSEVTHKCSCRTFEEE